MTNTEPNRKHEEKKRAGEYAAGLIEDGMTVGIGTGSTVAYLINRLGVRVKNERLRIRAVPTSKATADAATAVGIPLVDLNDVSAIDLTIDGVDEFTPKLDGIKGGGGALLYEKLVAASSSRSLWIADSAKAVDQLGAFPLPVEVVPFGYRQTVKALAALGGTPELRMRGREPFVTDGGHYIVDVHIDPISDPAALSIQLNGLPGVVEHGLFIGMTDEVVVASGAGVRRLTGKNDKKDRGI